MRAKSSSLIVDQLGQALRDGVQGAHPVGKGQAYSVQELRAITNHGAVWVRLALQAAVREGLWEVVRVQRRSITGVFQVVPAYRPKITSKKKKA